MKIKLLIVQLEAVAGDIDSNIKKAEKLLNESNQDKADLIILPELWTTGWDCPNFNKYSEEIFTSKTYNLLKKIALKYNSNIIGGSAILHTSGEKDRNTSIILDRKGNFLAKYDKFHLFSHRGQSEGKYLESGTKPLIVKTDIGKIGISICYDIRFPELFRLYTFNDTDFIINIAAWPKKYKDEYIILSKARAIENQTFFITSCLTGKINDNFNFSGNSAVYDYMGRTIGSLDEEEKVLNINLDLDSMKEYREQMPILKDTKKTYKITE